MEYNPKAQKLAVLCDTNFYNKDFNIMMEWLMLNGRDQLNDLIKALSEYKNQDYIVSLREIRYWEESDYQALRKQIYDEQGF